MSFSALHITRSHAFTLPMPPAQALEWFTPEGERRWAEGWNPIYLHPANGHTQAGMVFTTGHGGENTLWLMTRHDPAAGLVEYARLTPGSRVATVLVQCAAAADSSTRVTVIYAMTGLTESGNDYIRSMHEEKYRAFIESWAKAITTRI